MHFMLVLLFSSLKLKEEGKPNITMNEMEVLLDIIQQKNYKILFGKLNMDSKSS